MLSYQIIFTNVETFENDFFLKCILDHSCRKCCFFIQWDFSQNSSSYEMVQIPKVRITIDWEGVLYFGAANFEMRKFSSSNVPRKSPMEPEITFLKLLWLKNHQ